MECLHDGRAPIEEWAAMPWTNLVEVFRWRAAHHGDRPAFTFLADGEVEAEHLTYATMDRRARSVAAWLQSRGLRNERVLLPYPPGLDFIDGFLGCMYAGAVAVPMYPPRPRREDQRLQAIIRDTEARAALCVERVREDVARSLGKGGLDVLATDVTDDLSDRWAEHSPRREDLAELQYTSGSTGTPRGVMVSHGNLLHQAWYTIRVSGYDEKTVHVNWQPFFHDMGLCGTVLAPAFMGCRVYVMAPAAFLQKPIRWLRAISRYRGEGAPAPNFAYELCVTDTTPEERKGLDLSSWRVAWNGAEPVRADTLDRFSEVYGPYGYRRSTHLPCYGMAETTLCATACHPDKEPVVNWYRRDKLEQGQAELSPPDETCAVRLVSSGSPQDGVNTCIVDPETCRRCLDGKVGEIWVSGPSVAQGYWGRPQETELAFGARIEGLDAGPFLRTGDMGFQARGELFVTGRLKDLIIVRGRNIYPQDVEHVVEQSHAALQSDSCAAFSVDVANREELAIVVEVRRAVRRSVDTDEVLEAVRRAIGEHLELAPQRVCIAQPYKVPKTSSGKITRSGCRRLLLAGELPLLAEWVAPVAHEPAAPTVFLAALLGEVAPADRRRVLVKHIQNEVAGLLKLGQPPDPRAGFEHFGMDSMSAVELVNRLQAGLGGTPLSATLVFDQPNIEAVAEHIEQTLFGGPGGQAPDEPRDVAVDEPVAVVGLACRFPGAADADSFWRLLEQGRDGIREVPGNRWDIESYYDPDPDAEGKMYTRRGGFVDDIEGFDAAFFDISPREARSMDPQHRHLLETAWLACENAGIAPASLDGRRVGVFVGIATSDYRGILTDGTAKRDDALLATGNAHSAAAGRLSFVMGLKGPCVAVDTACSSSLVAVHQAAQSLRRGESEIALAGGVNAILSPDVTVSFCKAGMLSPDDRCKTFDAAADGYVRGEGCGVVVLKLLSDAQRDGDRVMAVLRGSAINQDGRSSGLTAPNGPSQTRVIADALAAAGVDPADVQYLEAHGTGTSLGDPIEVQAADAAYSQDRPADSPLLIGSVKTNLGHLEAAAGIAGLIKVILALQHRKIPASLHFSEPNPHIPWDALAVKVAQKTVPWPETPGRRIAGVSSFGFAGSNAHVVVEEAPQQMAGSEPAPELPVRILALSARTPASLGALAGSYANWIAQHPGTSLSDLCNTAGTGRNHFEQRAALVFEDPDQLAGQLAALAKGQGAAGIVSGETARGARRVGFLFSGQGSQYGGMGRELYDSEPAFRECMDRCAAVYEECGRTGAGPSLTDIIFGPDADELQKQTLYVQPALYALQVSLSAVWRSWGVVPDALLGHSLGEYAAACAAGVFDDVTGLRLVVERARLMQTLPPGGGMASVTAPVDVVEKMLAGDDAVCVSAYNGLNTVISGPAERLDALLEQFEKQELYCMRLPHANAFHSAVVEPILDQFEDYARGLEYAAPGGRIISGMTGAALEEGRTLDAAYWRDQARCPVRFAQGVKALFETAGCDVILELGPQAELMWLAQMCFRPDHRVLWVNSLAQGSDACKQMLSAAAQMYVGGTTLDFAGMDTPGRPAARLDLPTYRFQHEPYWPGPMGRTTLAALREGLYELEWIPAEDSQPRAGNPPQSWLLLSDDAGLGRQLAAQLESRGQDLVSVADAGLAPAIMEQLENEDAPDHVVLLFGPPGPVDPDGDPPADNAGVEKALMLARALVAGRRGTRLWLVTGGCQAVSDDETVNPLHSALWGFGRTFAIEHPDRYGGMIDLPIEGNPSSLAADLARALLADDGETQSALRNGQRMLARLQRHDMPAATVPFPVSAEGGYLITGGTGALGLQLARHLAERGAGRIVLASRSGGDEACAELVAELGAAGCRVDVVRADVALREQAAQLIDSAAGTADEFPLRGIVHAAGVLEGAPLTDLTPELLAGVMDPKVRGAWNLHAATRARGLELDMFVLFSSAASLLGLRGHANYSAANAYLDGLAHYRRCEGLPAVCINWGPWAEHGMATRMEAGRWEEMGTRLIPSRTAMEAFDRLGGGPACQVCMQPMNLPRWTELANAGRLPPILLNLMQPVLALEDEGDDSAGPLDEAGLDRAGGELVKRLVALDPDEREAALESDLRARVASVLGMDAGQVNPEAGFFDMGMNSIMAVELRNGIQSGLGRALKLQAAVIFNHPTIRKMTAYLLKALFEGRPSAGSVLRTEVDRLRSGSQGPLAIVGLGCRLPGAADADEYWRVLDEGRDEIREVPADRWDIAAFYDADPDTPGKMNTRWGGFVSDIDRFDAAFFDISPREARSLDPQQRMLLEVSWQALESANMAPRGLRETRGGVFIGISAVDYAERVTRQGYEKMDAYAGTGNAMCAAAGRLAFTLGWEGPALAIDTACSSSLVAVHQACSSLRSGECDLALAGGVNLLLRPDVMLTLSRAHMLSPDGRCKTFDASANGYVRSDGCALVLLKRLADAQRDGDRIMAVIRGSAVNQDGRSSGLTVPNGTAQERVISAALAAAGIDPAEVDYLEAHGTGTSLGDPIEVQAAAAALGRDRGPDDPLLIGSAKSNIGHTESAAGAAGLVKVVLALQHGRIPASLHFENPNPHIPWDDLPVKVAAESMPWPERGRARIAGVSSFGFVGTNAHVIVEEAPACAQPAEPAQDIPEREYRVLALSARKQQALHDLAGRYLGWLETNADVDLSDLCYTANTGRDHFEERAALVFKDRDELLEQLAALARGEEPARAARDRCAPQQRIAFLFTGQGSQVLGMGRGLYETEPVFRETLDRCAAAYGELRPDGPGLLEVMFEDAGDGRLDQTANTQPALYALEVSLAALWRSWGVEPEVVLGHSVGEYAAAFTAGVFSLEEGLGLIAERGRLMQSLPPGGSMAAVGGKADIVEAAIKDQPGVCVAAYNGAGTVISGPEADVAEVVKRLKAEKLRCTVLKTSHAFHSAMMDPILDEFRAFASGLSYRAAQKTLVSNVNGEALEKGRVQDADYWTGHIRRPVRFAQGVQALGDLGCDVLIEIGPHPVLVGMGQRCWEAGQQPLWVGTLRRKRDDSEQVLTALAQLYARGVPIDFAALDAGRSVRNKLCLPSYPFQRERYWVEETDSVSGPSGPALADCLYREVWEQKDASAADDAQAGPGTCLVLADTGGLGQALCRLLEERGRRCVCAAAADKALSEHLDRTIVDETSPLEQIVYLRGLDHAGADSLEQLEAAQQCGVESVLDLVKALIKRDWQGRLWIVTRGVRRVLDSDGVEPAQSPLWGMGKSLGMEHPELWGGLIDLASDGDPQAEELLRVIDAGDNEDQVALRAGQRWVARLERQSPPAGDRRGLAPDPDGSYLVTGGLGGVGHRAARRLAQSGARQLVLCGRHASRDAACDVVAELEREGCAVTVIAADVSRENDVARLLDEIGDSDLPPLKGIVHTAGVDAVVPFHELEHEELYRTLAAKVYGGWLLDRLTTERGIELSLFVCTSSIASVWGSVSQGAYSAANAFLDALVEQRAAQGKAATAVNYGPWSGVGMGAMNAEGVAWLRSRGIRALDPDFAIDAMEHLAAGNVTRAVLADVNWSMFRELAELRRPRPFLERLGGQETDLQADASGPTVLVTELTAAAADERDEILVRAIKLELAAVLQTPVDELREDLGFFDLGMDSLMAVEFRNALAKRLGRKLPATVVMDRPDIGAITAYILADILALAAGEEQARAGTVDRTEDEVGELSSTEVATALEEELKDILGGGDKGRRDE